MRGSPLAAQRERRTNEEKQRVLEKRMLSWM
jgi:hypothetical protein